MLYLSRLMLSNWRNFRVADIPLQSRMFIVGPNASGKSNILDAIRFLRDVSGSGGLRSAIEARGGVSKVRSLFARDPSDISIGCELSDDMDGKVHWKYELIFNQESGGIQQLRPVVKSERVWNDNTLVYDRASTDEADAKELAEFTRLEQPLGHRNFKEVPDFFSRIRYLHLVPQLVRASATTFSGRQSEYFGSDFIARAAMLNAATRNSYLRKISKALQLAVPQFSGLVFVTDELGKPHLQTTFRHWRPQGAHQWEDQFSDGTVRLVGFLWAILDGQGIVLLEEPELSLHPAIVRNLAEMIVKLQKRKDGRRQVIATSHSRDLLASAGISGDEIATLHPSQNGTDIRIASNDAEIRLLLEDGIAPGDVVLPATAPANAEQLLLEI